MTPREQFRAPEEIISDLLDMLQYTEGPVINEARAYLNKIESDRQSLIRLTNIYVPQTIIQFR